MNRIDRIFAELRADDRRALMPFITAGDPGMAATEALIPALQAAGASICEIGIPFSDPIADGPVIQASMMHALERGCTVDKIFAAIKNVRARTELGLIAMASYSIVHRLGLQAFVSKAKDAGFDGFIFPDLTLEESHEARAVAADADMSLSMLIAATTPIDRAKEIAAASTGFVYVMALAGITGERATLPPDLSERLAALRSVTDAPMAVGFGVSKPEHVREVVRVADAAIVGSALVRRIGDQREAGDDAAVQAGAAFTRELAAGLTS